MNDDGARGLEQVPFDIADIECTLQRWVPEACDLAGGLLTVAGRYPPGSEGADAARLVRWRLQEAMDMPADKRIDGLVVDCRELDYQWGDDLAVEPARVAALPLLRDLSLTLEVADVGLAHVAEADGIRSLRIGGGSFTGTGLERLAGLAGLETLALDGTGIDDDALAPIHALVHLRALTLGQTGITGAGLEGIGGLSRLETLHLHQTQLDDAGLAHLARLPSIRRLLVPDTEISNAGVEHLVGLGSLEEVDLRRTRVDEAGAMLLQERLPRCKVLV